MKERERKKIKIKKIKKHTRRNQLNTLIIKKV